MMRLSFACLPLNTLSLVPLPLVRAKVFCFPKTLERRNKSPEPAYYINLEYFLRFIRGKIFLR